MMPKTDKTRPQRPDESFLQRIGVFYLPPDVDITITPPQGYIDKDTFEWVSTTSYIVEQVDEQGQTRLKSSVSAFECAANPKAAIFADLRDTLVEQFGAIPVRPGLTSDLTVHARPGRPSEEFLHKVGIARLPQDVDLTYRSGNVDCAAVFVIARVNRHGHPLAHTEITARQTRAHHSGIILGHLRHVLVNQFGAVPEQPRCERF